LLKPHRLASFRKGGEPKGCRPHSGEDSHCTPRRSRTQNYALTRVLWCRLGAKVTESQPFDDVRGGSSIYRAPVTPSPITSPASLLSSSLVTYLSRMTLGLSSRKRSSSPEHGASRTTRLENWAGSLRDKPSTQQASYTDFRPELRESRWPTKPKSMTACGSCDSADKRSRSSSSAGF